MPGPSDPALHVPAPVTPAGIALAVAGAATTTLGIILGLAEITGLGIAMVLLVGFASVSVRLRKPNVDCTRALDATRTIVGRPVTVTTTVTRTDPGHSPRLRLHDPVDPPHEPTSTIRSIIPSLAPGETQQVSSLVRFAHRGICTVGAMKIEVTDPFGLARRFHQGPPPARVTVVPKIDRIAPPGFPVGADAHARAWISNALGTEFASLRDYVEGDDLRKVHWPTSARRDELVVRHDSQPHRTGCTVVLDVRDESHDPTTFEQAVSAAASILAAAAKAGQPIRLCTTGGFDSARGTGWGHLEFVLGTLAIIETGTTALHLPARGADPIVLLTTPSGVRSLGATAATAGSARATQTVVFDPSRPDGASTDITTRSNVVVVHAADTFATTWNGSIRARRTPHQVHVGAGS